VGDGIKPGSFSIRVSGSSPILDDGYGRLYVNNTGSVVGNVFYKHGIATVKNNKTSPSQSISTNGLKLAPFLPVDVNYTSSYTITEHTVVCKIRPTEFNASVFNHTIGYYKVVTGSYVSASQTVIYTNYEPNVSSSAVAQNYVEVNGTGSLVVGQALSELFDSGSLTPYVTTIGLYDKNYNLVAMAKLANPVPRTKNVDQTFIVKFDT